MTNRKFKLGDAVKTLVYKKYTSGSNNKLLQIDKDTYGVICDDDHIDTGIVTVEVITRQGIPTVFDYKLNEIEFVERPK